MFGKPTLDDARVRILEDKVRILENKMQNIDCANGNHAPWLVYLNSKGIPTPKCPNCYFHPNDVNKK